MMLRSPFQEGCRQKGSLVRGTWDLISSSFSLPAGKAFSRSAATFVAARAVDGEYESVVFPAYFRPLSGRKICDGAALPRR
jgi:hypothetical protein